MAFDDIFAHDSRVASGKLGWNAKLRAPRLKGRIVFHRHGEARLREALSPFFATSATRIAIGRNRGKAGSNCALRKRGHDESCKPST